MSDSETGEKAKPFDEGNELYQQRARAALPLLVRQVLAQKPIFYADLAHELVMPNPRNLNFVLGSIGKTLIKLGKKWEVEIPPIQCLVVNQTDELPGQGVGLFVDKRAFREMSKSQRRIVIEGQFQKIFTFTRWREVLAAFSLRTTHRDLSTLVRQAAVGGRAGGESEEHRQLKEYVAANPQAIGLQASFKRGITEHPLPSGDKLDVLFCKGDEWIAVEVKSHISDDDDLARGIFQCIKYRAVSEAYLQSLGLPSNVETLLVTTRSLTDDLVALKNALGVKVIAIEGLQLLPPELKV